MPPTLLIFYFPRFFIFRHIHYKIEEGVGNVIKNLDS